MGRINVTKTFLPPLDEYQAYVRRIWEADQLTNQGPLVLELEERLKDHLGITYCHFVANGTLALQLALRALDITSGEVITTPFTYVATTSAILWEGCTPVYVDIEPETFCIDADKIEAAITSKTKAILAVHVFGNPCNVEKIQHIAQKHNLKVIYDAAHAFGVEYNGESLFNYGDISTCSFHATKLFHTIEGGAIITKDKTLSEKIELMKRFGHESDEHIMLGINAKASEFQAAMGLCNLEYIDAINEARRDLFEQYDHLLGDKFYRPKAGPGVKYNFAYYPILFKTEADLLAGKAKLEKLQIFPRRYFWPSLNNLPYIKQKQEVPVSEDIARRILCLPMYKGLEKQKVAEICEALLS